MGAEPLHSIAEEQGRRRANAAASSGAPQGVGDTPAASGAAPAASAFSPRNLLGRASDWLRGIQSDDSIGTKHPTSQSRSDAPDQTVGDDEEGPDLGDTPVLDSTLNKQYRFATNWSRMFVNICRNLTENEAASTGPMRHLFQKGQEWHPDLWNRNMKFTRYRRKSS